MKTFEFTLKHDNGTVKIKQQGTTLAAALQTVLAREKAPARALSRWREVTEAEQQPDNTNQLSLC